MPYSILPPGRVRAMTRGDAHMQLPTLEEACRREYDRAWTAADYERERDEGSLGLVLVTPAKTLVGSMLYSASDLAVLIQRTLIAPAYRDRGVHAALLAHLLSYTAGARPVSVSVHERDVEQQLFYRSVGIATAFLIDTGGRGNGRYFLRLGARSHHLPGNTEHE